MFSLFGGHGLYNLGTVHLFGAFIDSNQDAVVGSGRSIYNGGTVIYVLPLPKGYFLEGTFLCKPRQCPSPLTGRPEPCPVQACDTVQFTSQYLANLPQGPIDHPVPRPCARGFYGNTTDQQDQSSALCSGLCVRRCPPESTIASTES